MSADDDELFVDPNIWWSADGDLIRSAGMSVYRSGGRSSGTIGALSRSRSRSRARSGPLSRSRSRSRSSFDDDRGATGGAVLASWTVVRDLFQSVATSPFPFESLLDQLPPDPDGTAEEIEGLRRKQASLVADRQRQEEILRQADVNDLSDIYRPLGIDNGGYPDTETLIDIILETAERVGYFYKEVFNRRRPNDIDPRLRPFIDVPPHAAFPSNHSFQMFCVAEVFSRILPEHPGAAELFYVAQRVAENREYAGLHYPSDTRAGRRLAQRFAPYLVNICRHNIGRALAEWR